ncbi:phytase [Pontibacter sp. H249]|uniref:phytase n=1 Tax=Pontibacter sp. H249 TaxID=3133420 RepID=UPI0030BD976B
MSKYINLAVAISLILLSCQAQSQEKKRITDSAGKAALKPILITEETRFDTDDPAIWINSEDVSKSLIIGTDKQTDGALYVYNLHGKIIADKVVTGLKRPNNVDVAYGLKLNNTPLDIAVVTERESGRIRVFTLPDMKAIDNGGIEVFVGESSRKPMGIALYQRPSDNEIFAIISRKEGPETNYLWQYHLQDAGNGTVKAQLIRKFGKFSGRKEIESIAVDDALGYVYYSDEGAGIRKYYADPAKNDNRELAFFGSGDFKKDMEGISVYATTDATGYILISNQQSNSFMVYKREGDAKNPHSHTLIAEIPMSTLASDGSEVTNINLGPKFPKGLFVAMSEGKVFHYYDWRDIDAIIKRVLKTQVAHN